MVCWKCDINVVEPWHSSRYARSPFIIMLVFIFLQHGTLIVIYYCLIIGFPITINIYTNIYSLYLKPTSVFLLTECHGFCQNLYQCNDRAYLVMFEKSVGFKNFCLLFCSSIYSFFALCGFCSHNHYFIFEIGSADFPNNFRAGDSIVCSSSG